MAIRKKKKDEEEKQAQTKKTGTARRLQAEEGAMVRPSGKDDPNSRPLTAREIAEEERKRKAAKKKKK